MKTNMELTVITKDLDFLDTLFKHQVLTQGLKVDIDDITSIVIESFKRKPGMTGTEMILSLIISVEASLITHLLLNLLSNNDESIIQETTTKTTIKKEDFEIYIEKTVKNLKSTK